ncbi:MAG: DUF4397 domain-containing protein [Bacteroidota bacterium]|nr:DUF4397 domain-containing protein [Bacteroidota bacterium]
MKNFKNKFNMLSQRNIAILMTSVAFSFASCKDDDDDMDTGPVATYAGLMVTHASPDGPGVDLLVDNVKINNAALNYPGNTPYIPVTSGNRNIKINVGGTTTTVINQTLPLAANKSYSVFAIDSVSVISALAIEDNLANPAAGKAHIRFIHLSPDAPAVDVALDGGAIVFGDYTFKEYSDFTPLDAGTYDLEVRVAGTSTVALDIDPIVLSAGKIYTVFAKGFLGGSGSQALGAQIIINK